MMPRRTRRLPVILVFCLLTTPSLAEDHADAQPLRLEQALTLSVKSHPLISAKRQEYQAAISDLRVARWAAFPNAGFSFRGFRQDEERDVRDQEVLTVSQPIWTGGRISGNIEIAKAKRDAAEAAVIEAEQSILSDTVRAFVDVHRAKSKRDISFSNVREHERLSAIIERRVKAATSPEVDLRLANARLAFSKSQLLQNANALDIAKAELEQLIGKPLYEITAPQNLAIHLTSRGEAEKAVMAFSPALRKLRSEIASLSGAKKVSTSFLYPQLSLGFEKRFGELPINQDDEQVFVGLDFQPGAGLSSRASISASTAKKGALENTLAALEREVRRELRVTWREYSAAKLQLSPTKLLVDSTAEVVGSYLRQYTVGRKSWLDVLNAQREMVQAKQALVDHEAMLTLASYKVKIMTGNLTRDTVAGEKE